MEILGMCSMLFNCKCYFQIPENAKFNKKGTKEWIERIYHRRNVLENLHLILKEQLLFDENLNAKGFEAIGFYARQFLVTLLFVALTRERRMGL